MTKHYFNNLRNKLITEEDSIFTVETTFPLNSAVTFYHKSWKNFSSGNEVNLAYLNGVRYTDSIYFGFPTEGDEKLYAIMECLSSTIIINNSKYYNVDELINIAYTIDSSKMKKLLYIFAKSGVGVIPFIDEILQVMERECFSYKDLFNQALETNSKILKILNNE